MHHLMGHIACRLITALSLTEAEVYGEDNLKDLPRPFLLMMNHSSHWDPVEVWAYFPEFVNFLVKEELHEVPIFGTMSALSGNIPVHRNGVDVKAIKMALRLLKDGVNFGIFAEGTRTEDGSIIPFKDGGVALASRAKVPIVPMYISGTHKILPKKSRILKAGRVKLYILKPVTETMDSDCDKIRQTQITREIELKIRDAREQEIAGWEPSRIVSA